MVKSNKGDIFPNENRNFNETSIFAFNWQVFTVIGCLCIKVNLNQNLLTQSCSHKGGKHEVLGKRIVGGRQLWMNGIFIRWFQERHLGHRGCMTNRSESRIGIWGTWAFLWRGTIVCFRACSSHMRNKWTWLTRTSPRMLTSCCRLQTKPLNFPKLHPVESKQIGAGVWHNS